MAKDNEKRILLIDDDPDDLEIGRRALENGGYRVMTASDGQEGLKTAEKEPPDLIITDLLMPKQDGLSTFEQLKKNPLFKNIPVIICTSIEEKLGFSFSEDDMETHYGEKPAAYFSKPVNARELVETVRRILKNS